MRNLLSALVGKGRRQKSGTVPDFRAARFDSVVGALLPVVYAAVIFAVVRMYSPRGREASTASNVAATAGFVLALVVAGFVFFIVMLIIGLSGSP